MKLLVTLSLEQLKEIANDMENRKWVWIENLESGQAAYYQAQMDWTRGRAFCCGYPGIGYSFNYADYGITWRAYWYNP